jgi:hypothetical protein
VKEEFNKDIESLKKIRSPRNEKLVKSNKKYTVPTD